MSKATAKAALVLLGLIFLVPLALAWLMYTGVIDFHPRETSNLGILVDPPVEARLPDGFGQDDLERHWVLVYPLPTECAQSCREDLAGIRQVRRALGRDAERLRIVALSGLVAADQHEETIEDIDPDALVVPDSSGMLSGQLKRIGDGTGAYLIDPLGNIMMHYPRGTNPDDIRRDLEHLLRYAKTDPQ